MVLVQLREDGRNLALSKSVIQRVVDGLRENSQSRRGIPVNRDIRLEPVVQLVGSHIGQRRQGLQLGHQLRGPLRQFLRIRIFYRILELGAAHAVFDRQILHRLHVESNAVDLRQLRLQSTDDRGRVVGPLIDRLQVDLDPALVWRGVGAIHSDKRRQAVDRLVLQNDFRQLLLPLRHGIE